MATMTLMKFARMTRGLTLDDIVRKAKKKKLEYSRYNFARIENTDYNANEKTRKVLAKILKIDKDFLFDEDGKARVIKKKMVRKFAQLMFDRGEE